MKVYVLESHERYEDSVLVGVFSSREKARAAMNGMDDYSIRECELDSTTNVQQDWNFEN